MSYRDDREALRQRAEDLAAELEAAQEKLARREADLAERAERDADEERELAELRQQVARLCLMTPPTRCQQERGILGPKLKPAALKLEGNTGTLSMGQKTVEVESMPDCPGARIVLNGVDGSSLTLELGLGEKTLGGATKDGVLWLMRE